VGPDAHVLEIGAGLGSLTLPLARTGAEVIAVELDRFLVPALEEVVGEFPRVRVVVADAVSAEWNGLLGHGRPWMVVANLPYNVAVPVVMRLLEAAPPVERMLVMVQREVGERLAADPGQPAFGAVSLRVAYRAEARLVRRVSRTVFWPLPNVDSVLVSLVRRPPPVRVDEVALWHVVDTAFNQRRKTMRGAMVRLGLERAEAEAALAACAVDLSTRPERLGLEAFACLAEQWLEVTRSAPAEDSPR
jgi:16S rRNA (adenine1518-N6/adenine1519-N6)-dimethyltransferase